ncbi:hypothetical protein L0P54_08770 [Anaerosalibacter bizertensis]|uniref:Uncharacterized protein n=1 Tax=Anaerosalibacter bizertensis TaxID=932217 RepID=A0A9Q4ABX9_9FIRM|nr:hypothetical protein [Anaerosalibacter bizertensis]MBV1818234.1 hypothetical protein [Bacteroidales bacterium MSK.15.36]MCB5559385.1 hypothetical protein [Anaerosalibacter bizertensis]MCG4564584.1 hypothetical protein [Anaerosalibacter bizertensis]MCG4583081.1 hypothetical protein [Anaerosalibacter bizertensis]MCG4584472.1 hypothetical protein [Anaerosalibacter bizertensis]
MDNRTLNGVKQDLPLANVNNEELNEIKKFEENLGNKYYILAFERK